MRFAIILLNLKLIQLSKLFKKHFKPATMQTFAVKRTKLSDTFKRVLLRSWHQRTLLRNIFIIEIFFCILFFIEKIKDEKDEEERMTFKIISKLRHLFVKRMISTF